MDYYKEGTFGNKPRWIETYSVYGAHAPAQTGSFANGYEHIRAKHYSCPVHGEVGEGVIIPSGDHWVHQNCGSRVDKYAVRENKL
jgi:hypothetical protein